MCILNFHKNLFFTKNVKWTNIYKVFFLLIIIVNGCQNRKESPSFKILSFDPISDTDLQQGSDTINFPLDLTRAVYGGIKIPTHNQREHGKFKTVFELKNHSNEKAPLYYKIYYQNESYKRQLSKKSVTSEVYNEKASENFYGSWKDVNTGFKKTMEVGPGKSITIVDSIQIVGNPRDEKRYYGNSPRTPKLFEVIETIKKNSKWHKKIKEKATANQNSIEKQLFLDAKHTIENSEQKNNNRWKRNPRMGVYSFIMVVGTKEAINEIPDYITNINKRNDDGLFVNPYYYFLHGQGSKIDDIEVVKANKHLKVKAKLNQDKGVYVSFSNKSKPNAYNPLCGPSLNLFQNAHYKHHFNYINKDWPFNNIPLVKDIFEEDYTQEEFYANKEKYDDARVKDYPANPEFPCSTIVPDSGSKVITLINPGNKDGEKPIKQQVAIETRIGLTYGKFRGKIKFPELMNRHNVWNGVTNAFWLFTESRKQWNRRDLCEEGYVAKGGNDKENVQYVDQATYSEIDIEIIKESKFWSKNKKNYDPAETDNIIVACTNWDLACQDPPEFGQKFIAYDDQEFLLHRWYDTYRALTSKTPVNEDEMFQRDFYYYEIGWYPDSIVWKVGPDLQNLKTVGYMDESVTKIPNNQMIMMVSQEFHHGDWWPFTPFHQNDIPYPKNDIKGVIHEMWIE